MNERIFRNRRWVLSVVAVLVLVACNAAAPSMFTAGSAAAEPVVLPKTVTQSAAEAAGTSGATESDLTAADAERTASVDSVASEAAVESVTIAALTEAEAAGLRFMREEEKLAHDVYTTLYVTWDLPIFQNIANSEQTHTEAVLRLLNRYGIADPAADSGVGVFVNPDLQALYDELVAQGSQSLTAALQVGAAIEEIDILDLEEYSLQTTKEDILTLYANLTKGSRNHLRSFVKMLSRRSGETYMPQYLSQNAYALIIDGGIERGNGRD